MFYWPKAYRSVSTSSIRRCEKPPAEENESHWDEDAEDEAHHVLSMALQFVPKHGWSREALIAGAEASGLPGVGHGMFPRGGIELVHFFYTESNARLVEEMKAEKAAEEEEGAIKKRQSRFIRDALVSRLSMIHPYMDTWPQAMGLMALPQNAGQSLKNLGNLVDDIWHHAGDKAVRFDWYTKRMSLAAIYKSTEFFMLQDKSDDYVDTWTFLDRRMNDVKTVGRAVGQFQKSGDVLCDGVWSSCLTLQNMLGMNYRRR